MTVLSVYLPQDRLRALARGEPLPEHVHGAALLVDISGFTPLTERLARELGPRRGVEELTRRINAVYDALIGEVERYGGSVISFAGDAITCWFEANDERGMLNAEWRPAAAAGEQPPFSVHPSSFSVSAAACACALQAALGAAAFDAEFAAGQTLAAEQAVALALEASPAAAAS